MQKLSIKELYKNHQNKVSDKWESYLKKYDEYFFSFKDQCINVLEIGIQNGGSLEILSEYFPVAEHIVGCDVQEECRALEYSDSRIKVIVGDACEKNTLKEILSISPKYNIIIDDGSHTSSDTISQFINYFPHLEFNGLYVIEDLHCAYWSEYGGGLANPYTSMEFIKHLLDIVNFEAWGISNMNRVQLLKPFIQKFGGDIDEVSLQQIHSIEIFNSLCFIRKKKNEENLLGKRTIAGKYGYVKSGIKEVKNTFLQVDPQPLLGIAHSKILLEQENIKLKNELALLQQSVEKKEEQISSLIQLVKKKDTEISSLNQHIHEISEQVASSKQTLQEKNSYINSLQQSVQEKDVHINYLTPFIEENRMIKESKSWRILTFFAMIKSIILKPQSYIRCFISRSSRQLWYWLPLSRNKKEKLKYILFRYTGGILKWTLPYKNWQLQKQCYSSEYINTVASYQEDLEVFTEYKINPPIDSIVKAIAFYLPQFHPFPENDEWWGKGFTEWTNVKKARPNFIGHYQQHEPIHYGYYDLRDPDIMVEQARLAKQYGIHGFSYYFYWFNGKILMREPLEKMLENKSVDIPFCLTWANENWTRRWDGLESEILISQSHSTEDSLSFIRHINTYFCDDRYIKIDGKPLLIVYRSDILPNAKEMLTLWREEAKKLGWPDLYLVAATTFGTESAEFLGFNASVQFPPHNAHSNEISDILDFCNKSFQGKVYDYRQVVENSVQFVEPSYKLFRSAMLSWDNTARRQDHSHIFHYFSLFQYKRWLSHIVKNVKENNKYTSDEKLIFINAWNEWAEGTHLEPDKKYGYGYLQATYDVLSGSFSCDQMITSTKADNFLLEDFDEEFYLSAYPDIKKMKIDPFRHFCDYGRAEGRIGSPLKKKI